MYVWNSGGNIVTIGFNPNEQVARWTATINGQFYEGSSPLHVYKPVGPMPGDTKLTQAKINQIRGGMTSAEVANIVGRPIFSGLKADFDNQTFVSDKGKMDKWIDGANSLTVAYNPDGRAARWSGTINNTPFDIKDDAFVMNSGDPKPDPTKLTKANVDRIMGGMSPAQVHQILGKAQNQAAVLDQASQLLVADKGKGESWSNGNNSLTIAYHNNKVVRWYGTIDGQQVDKSDQTYAATAKPQTLISRANYDKITNGMSFVQLVQSFGQPTAQSPLEQVRATKTVMAHTKFDATWNDGKGGHMKIYFINGIVTNKSEFALK
jgi:outer membrane protein assembly factor BamE (lipoprotein component of BamABCDE complex)